MKQFVSMESFSHLFREKREILLSFWNLKKTQNIILGLFLLFAAVFCCREAARSPFWGSDASEYFLMQRGFEQTFSPRIPMNSYAEACKEIPESIRYPVPPPSYPNSTGHGNAGVTLYNGSVYAYHSVIYSVFTLPFKYIAGIFGKGADVSFVWANSFFLFLLVVSVLLWMPLGFYYRLALAILLMYSPGVTIYLSWIHPEIFLLTGLGLSMIAYCRGWYKTAILIGALVSWTNMAASLLPFFMGLYYLYVLIREWKTSRRIPWLNGILAFWAGFVVLLPTIYTRLVFGSWSIVKDAIKKDYITFARVFDLWFGLDQGLILVSFLLPFLFLGAVCYCVKNRNWNMLFIAAATVLLTVAVNTNVISHTGVGVSRYLSWIFVPVIFVCFSLQKLRCFPYLLIVLFVTSCWQQNSLWGNDYFAHNRIAKKVLETYPALYNPPEDIFILKNCPKRCYCWFFCSPRTVDPYPHFKDSEGRVRKIMLTNRGCFVPILDEFSCQTEEEKKFLQSALENFKKSKKWCTYINVPASMNISSRPVWMKKVSLPVALSFDKEIVCQGFYAPEASGRWMGESTAKIMLPVSPQKQGVFLKFKGSAFLHKALPEQTLKISSHGRLLYQWTQSLDALRECRFFFLPQELMENGFIELDFSLEKPLTVPKDYGVSEDARKLGFFLQSMEILPAKIPFDNSFESKFYQRIAGFYPPEGIGIWSISQMAAVELMPAVSGKLKLVFQILTVPSVKTVKVFYKGKPVSLWKIKGTQGETQEITLDLPEGISSIPLSFVPLVPMIPGKVYKDYNDFRNLGVRLIAVEYQ